MKILYVITGLGQGGAERVVCDLADEMVKRGHKVKIVYLVGKALTTPKSNNIEIIKISLTNVISLPKTYILLSKTIKSYRPDIVHSHMVHANLLTRMVRMITPMDKLISTAHSSNEGGSLRMFAYRMTNHLADLSTNVSNTAVASFESKYAVPKGVMKTLYNGVRFDDFNYNSQSRKEIINELKLDESSKLILAVGRFNAAKNYFNLIMAINHLKDISSIPFTVIIAGDGELKLEIERLIQKLNLLKDVVLLGNRRDISKLMSACDVFILSSDYEGLPTVLIEALACQANVVSTDVSGAREIIGDCGKVVPIRQFKALANAIEDTLQTEQKNVLGRQYAKGKFDINIISDEWLKIYYEKK